MLYDKKWDDKLFDLSKPSLEALSHLLRHREMWPQGFTWNYSVCDKCAMGLARVMWEKDYISPCPDDTILRAEKYMQSTFGLDMDIIDNIFEGEGWDAKTDIDFEAITPEMVADKIDKHLQSKE